MSAKKISTKKAGAKKTKKRTPKIDFPVVGEKPWGGGDVIGRWELDESGAADLRAAVKRKPL